MRRVVALVTWFALGIGCVGKRGATSPSSARPATTAASAVSNPEQAAPQTSGTLKGAVKGYTFGKIVSVIWIGVPESPATTAIYLSDTPLTCRDVDAKGWMQTIKPGTHVFEMITTGTSLQSYATSTAKEIPAGEAEVNYILAGPAKDETRATAGSVVLTSLYAGKSVSGTFSCSFGTGTDRLDGEFTATSCPDAHEP